MALSYITNASGFSNFSITINSGGQRLLLVHVVLSTPSGTVDAITHGGVSMTKIRDDAGTNLKGSYWYLLNPEPGTKTIALTITGSTNWVATAIVIAGAKQQAPEANAGTATGSASTSTSTNITTLTNNAWVVDGIGFDTAGATGESQGGGQTVRISDANTEYSFQSTKPVATAGATSASWTHNSFETVHSVAAFEEDTTNLGIYVKENITVTESVSAALDVFQIFLFKNHYAFDVEFTPTWEGQSTVAASSSPVILQVYNQNSSSWETVDTDNTTGANTDFTLTGTISTNVANYYDANNYVSHRVYQSGQSDLKTDLFQIQFSSAPNQVNVNDSITVSESIKIELNSFINKSESITVTENVDPELESYINKSDTITVTENSNVALAHQINVNDTITTSENVKVELNSDVRVSETVTLTESVALNVPIALSVSDNVTVSENVSLDIPINITVSDNITVTENIKMAFSSDISVSDSVYVYEGRNRVANNSFELDTPGDQVVPTSWNSFNNTADVYEGVIAENAIDGTQTYKIESVGTVDTGIRQNITGLIAGNTYVVSVWVKSLAGLTTGSFVVSNEQNGSGGNQTTGANWSGAFEGRRTITWTPNTTSWEIFLGMGAFGTASAGTIWFDDVKVYAFEKVELNSDVRVSDSVTVTEAVALETPLLISVSENITVTDTPNIALVHQVVASDTITVTDTPNLIVSDPQINVSDSITVSEALNMNLVSDVRVSDSITLTENVRLDIPIEVNVLDSIVVSESTKIELNSFINKSDSITVTENVVMARESNPNVSDSITVSESVSVVMPDALQINVSDTITVTEFVSINQGYSVHIFDNVTLTENVVVVVSDPQVVASDSITVTEFFDPELEANISVSDTVTITENVDPELNSFVYAYETIAVLEDSKVVLESDVRVSDSVTVTENVSLENTRTFSVSDTITTTESTKVELNSDVRVSDSISITENNEFEVPVSMTISDSVAVSENVKVELNSDVRVSDTITTTENVEVAISASQINVSDTITTSENVIVSIPSMGDIQVSDTVTINENFEYIVTPLFINVSDSITVTDTPIIFRQLDAFLITVSDSVTLTESVVIRPPYFPDPAPKLIFVEGRLAYKIVEASIPHYIYVT